MSKRKFKITKPELIEKFVSSPKTVDKNGILIFSNIEMLMIARATGLRSKKRRHIHKRFKLVISDALQNWLDSQEKLDNNIAL